MPYRPESVHPFIGDWRFIASPPELVRADNIGAGCALAVNQGGANFLDANPDAEAVTFLSHEISIPRHGVIGDVRVSTSRKAFVDSLRAIGYRIMRYVCEIDQVTANYVNAVLKGELESPADTFARAPLSDPGAATRGVGYTTVERNKIAESFRLGWCDPLDGWRSEVVIDMAPIRQQCPDFTPVYAVSGVHRF